MHNHTITIQEMSDLLKATTNTHITNKDTKKDTYRWMEGILVHIRYPHLGRHAKGIVLAYLTKCTGYTHTHVRHLVADYCRTGHLTLQQRTQPVFPTVYTTGDIDLLGVLSEAYGHPDGKRLTTLCRELYAQGDTRFIRLRHLSVSHYYNLRKHQVFLNATRTFEKTKATSIPIGRRQKPHPGGKPGYLRVDSVHQGDRDGEKGVYHLTLVDEVTQWTVLTCVPVISERYMLPALQEALSLFPFHILNFHSDNGSEYINYAVQKVLTAMHITQTKGRPRKCNDNALVESKNGSVVRKHMGYHFIPKRHAPQINTFYHTVFNDFLNYHCPCHFPEEVMLPNGKRKTIYNDCMTPCAKLLSLPNVSRYLREEITTASLTAGMQRENHLTAAQAMQKAKQQLFSSFSSYYTTLGSV